jgi:hypothetical protein
VEWTDPESGAPKLYEHTYFLHQERPRDE